MSHITFDKKGVYVESLANDGKKYGISQYRFALNYELAGKTLQLEDKHTLHSLCKENVAFDGVEYKYQALKLSAAIYFVCLGMICGVVDLEQNYVTLIDGDTYIMGSVGENSTAHVPAGDDMVGTNVAWILGVGRYTCHNYNAVGKCRVSWSPRDKDEDEFDITALKIRYPMYLVDIKGGVRALVSAPFFTQRVVMLQDYDHMMTVGCVFEKGSDPTLFSGYAKFLN